MGNIASFSDYLLALALLRAEIVLLILILLLDFQIVALQLFVNFVLLPVKHWYSSVYCHYYIFLFLFYLFFGLPSNLRVERLSTCV